MSSGAAIHHDRLRTLWDVVAYHAETRPAEVALQYEGRRTTYGELSSSALKLAAGLAARGVGKSDRIAYLGKNSDWYFTLLFAAARLGSVLVPLNWRLAKDEWRYILEDSDSVLLFADDEFLGRAEALAAELDLPAAEPIPTGSAMLDEDAALPQAGDIIFQVYTSGTTGRPKGAMLTHRNMLALRAPGYRAGLEWFPRSSDTSLVVLPVAHIAGTAYGLFGLYSGGRLVIARDFDPGETLRLIEAEAATHLLLAPAAMQQVLNHPAAPTTDLGSLRFLTYGASPIPGALLEQALALLRCGFVQMYGMTEAAGGVVALTPEDHRAGDPQRLRSAGRAMPGVGVAIFDDQDRPMEAGRVGEIAIRSEAVMAGYWRQPQATAQTIVAGGWLRTGDVGRLDEDGYLFVLDRAKDMIVSGGENVYPAEVENAIFGHPDVAEVAVIGVPSARWGEEVMAIIVPREGREPTLETIADWARSRIAGFKVPKRLTLVDELPRNAGNKVLRRLLREPFWEAHERRVH